MTMKHRSDWVTHNLNTTSPSGHPLLLSPQSGVPACLPASSHTLSPMLAASQFHEPAELSLKTEPFLIQILLHRTHNTVLTWLIPTHSLGFSSNIIYSGRLRWGPSPAVVSQLQPVTIQLSLFSTVYDYSCACVTALLIAYPAFPVP